MRKCPLLIVAILSATTIALADRESYQLELARRRATRAYQAALRHGPRPIPKSARDRLAEIARQQRLNPQLRQCGAGTLIVL